MAGGDKRKHPRFPIAVPVTLLLSDQPQPIGADLVNLSQGGCFFATAAPLKPGWTAITFFMARTGLCAATGTITRDENGLGFAVEFANVNDALRGFLQQLDAVDDDARAELIGTVAGAQIKVG